MNASIPPDGGKAGRGGNSGTGRKIVATLPGPGGRKDWCLRQARRPAPAGRLRGRKGINNRGLWLKGVKMTTRRPHMPAPTGEDVFCLDRGVDLCDSVRARRAGSSVGRASALQAGGQRFESSSAYQTRVDAGGVVQHGENAGLSRRRSRVQISSSPPVNRTGSRQEPGSRFFGPQPAERGRAPGGSSAAAHLPGIRHPGPGGRRSR